MNDKPEEQQTTAPADQSQQSTPQQEPVQPIASSPLAPAEPPAAPAPQLPEVDNQKTFGLTANETQMLVLVQNNQNSIFSILLSHIAAARLAYPVSERTQFVLNGQMTELKVGELKEQVPTATASTAPAAGDSAIKTSDGGQVA